MKKSVYQTIITMLILVIVISVFGVFKTAVGLNFETANPNDCISIISGRDLCQQMLVLKIIIIFCLIIVSGMLSFRVRILKD